MIFVGQVDPENLEKELTMLAGQLTGVRTELEAFQRAGVATVEVTGASGHPF